MRRYVIIDDREEEIIALIDSIENKLRLNQHNGLSEHKRLEIEHIIHEICASYKHQPVDDLIEECYLLIDSL